MTQRSWSVQPFDSLSITKIQPPLRGFDIEIDTYINMQFNFNAIYDLLDQFAQQINNNTNDVFESVVTENISSVSEASADMSNTMQNTVDQGNVNGSLNLQGYQRPKRRDLHYDDITDGRYDLLKQLYALQQADTSVERKAKLQNIMTFMNTSAETAINLDGLNAVHNQAQEIIYDKKQEITAIQQQIINEYENFLASLQTTLVSDETENTTFGTTLFTANDSVIETIKSEPNPTKSYLELNKTVMDGFANALNKYSAEELDMSLLTYNETKNYVMNTREAVHQ